MKPFGLAVIGTSWITGSFILAARLSQEYEVRAVYSRTLEKGKPFADANQIPTIYTSIEEMLKDPTIDVVYIASPNDMHYPQAKQCMLAGKDVIGEKPLVSTRREMEDLIQTMESTGRIVVEAITSRHMPNLEIIRKNLDRIGGLRIIRSDMSQYSSRYNALLEGKVANVFDPTHSGGALYDIGIYPVSLVLDLLGKPEKIHYTANLHSNGVDLSGLFVMEYPHTKAVCSLTKDSYGPNATIFEGEKGYILMDGAPSRIGSVTLVMGGTREELGVDQVEETMYYEAKYFAKLLRTRNKEELLHLSQHSLNLAEIMEEGRKQANVIFEADKR